jgi:hypothetical protein
VCCVRAGCAGGVVTARNPCVGLRDGVLADGPVVARRRQGVADELMRTTGRALGNESEGRAHQGRWSTASWGGGSVRQRAAGSPSEGGSAVTLASSWSCRGGREK